MVIFSPFIIGPYILHFKQYPSVVAMVLTFHYQRCNLNTSVSHHSKFMFFPLKGGVQRVILVKNRKQMTPKSKKTVHCALFFMIRFSTPHQSLASLSHNSHYATQRTTEIPALWLERHVLKFSIGDLEDTNKWRPQQQSLNAPILNVEV